MMLARTKSLLGLLTLWPVAAWADHTTIGLQTNVTGPSTTSTAEPMESGRFGITLQYQQVDFKSISAAKFKNAAEQDRNLHATDSISNS